MENNADVFQGEFNKIADPWKRIVAMIVDILIILVVASITGFLSYFLTTFLMLNASLVIFFLKIGIFLVYFTYFIGKSGQTPGKMVLGLRIFKSEGSKVSFSTAFVRSLVIILYAIPNMGWAVCLISIIIMIIDKKHQALHDKVCQTVVMEKG
jgi:uncharacterized RDD family membrane protein YckC